MFGRGGDTSRPIGQEGLKTSVMWSPNNRRAYTGAASASLALKRVNTVDVGSSGRVLVTANR